MQWAGGNGRVSQNNTSIRLVHGQTTTLPGYAGGALYASGAALGGSTPNTTSGGGGGAWAHRAPIGSGVVTLACTDDGTALLLHLAGDPASWYLRLAHGLASDGTNGGQGGQANWSYDRPTTLSATGAGGTAGAPNGVQTSVVDPLSRRGTITGGGVGSSVAVGTSGGTSGTYAGGTYGGGGYHNGANAPSVTTGTAFMLLEYDA